MQTAFKLLIVAVVIGLAILNAEHFGYDYNILGDMGDYWGAVFNSLAFAFLAYSIYLQQKQFEQSTKEFSHQMAMSTAARESELYSKMVQLTEDILINFQDRNQVGEDALAFHESHRHQDGWDQEVELIFGRNKSKLNAFVEFVLSSVNQLEKFVSEEGRMFRAHYAATFRRPVQSLFITADPLPNFFTISHADKMKLVEFFKS